MTLRSTSLPVGVRGDVADWIKYRERGSMLLLRAMAGLSCRLGRRASRFFLYLIAIYFFLFAPTVRRHSRAYLRRALGRSPGARDRFRYVLNFATTIHDRVYLANGRFELFQITVDGEQRMQELFANGQGALLLGAHMGSFEVIHCIGRRQPGLRVSMAMYEDNARKINTMLDAISAAAKPEIIGLGHLGAMLTIRDRLDQGVFVGVLADRTLGHEPSQPVNLLGAPARLPVGPMRAAALLRRSVIFMAGQIGRAHV
jgi:predicted LPLAT superfamily acyltransferase